MNLITLTTLYQPFVRTGTLVFADKKVYCIHSFTHDHYVGLTSLHVYKVSKIKYYCRLLWHKLKRFVKKYILRKSNETTKN